MKMHNHQLYKKKLREKAEELINKNPAAIQELQPDDAKKLIEDLQIHQVELEMQNEELRRTQVELAESQEKYSDLFDFAPIGYFILDESTRIQEVNLTGADLLGFRRSELLNLRFSNFISPESQDDFYLHQKRLIETATRQLCELKLIKKDRASFYAKLVSVVVKDRSNNLQNFRTAVADITEEMRARKLQRENEQKFRMLFNQMVSGAALFEVIHDEFGQPADYRFIEINPVFEKITGKNRNQVIGNTLLEVFPETEQYWFQEFEKVALTGYSNQIENYHQGLDKYFFVTMFRPQADQLALTFIDISERVHIEKALQEAHDDLEKRVEERTAELENSYASLSLEIAERRRLSFRFLNAQEDERRRIALALHDELGQDLSVLKLDVDSLKKKIVGESNCT